MAGVIAVSGNAVLAACGGSSSGGAYGGAGTSSAPPTSPPATSSSPSKAGGSSTGIVALDAVPVGGAVSATLDGKPIIVSRPTAGKVVAFSAICTHRGCTVAPAGAKLNCPCHGSVYEAATGKNIAGPAPAPLPAVRVTVANGQVVPS